MPISHLLEDFGMFSQGTPVALTDVTLEEQKLEAFENGYQAGWDDSVKAQQGDSARLTADFAQNIKDLSFTYHEAYNGMLAAMEPLVRQLVDTVLPDMARASVGAQVAEIILGFIKNRGPQPVNIMIAPGNAVAVEAVLPDDESFPIEIVEEPTMAEGQAHITFGQGAEREIDLQTLLQDISGAVDAFFATRPDQHKETA